MTVANEIDRASKLARDIIAEYVAWSDKVMYGAERSYGFWESYRDRPAPL